MTLRRREALLLGGVAAAAAAAGFLAAPRLFDESAESAAALQTAVFPDLTGTPRRLADWQGRVVVVNFWATWCPPCIEEIPVLVEVRKKHLAAGVEIVGIAIDKQVNVAEFTRKIKIPYPVLVADAAGIELMRRLGNKAGGLPFTVFLDRKGGVAKRKLGALNRPELEQSLAAMLKE